ncbi:MAG: hypothetical protein P4L41_04525 [Flavipsychrobacter sp.]|nr:hypothetical protein [Flavipsychrobacter sp.]
MNELGKKIAELTTIAGKTDIVEQIRKNFNNDLERVKGEIQINVAEKVKPLEALLQKDNITYQLFTAEYIRLRFERLDSLYFKVYELQKYCESNFSSMFISANSAEEFKTKRDNFYKCYDEVNDAFYKAMIYINENVQVSVIDFLNETFKAVKGFDVYYTTSIRLANQLNATQSDSLSKTAILQEKALNRMENAIDKLPELLRIIEVEFKNHFANL